MICNSTISLIRESHFESRACENKTSAENKCISEPPITLWDLRPTVQFVVELFCWQLQNFTLIPKYLCDRRSWKFIRSAQESKIRLLLIQQYGHRELPSLLRLVNLICTVTICPPKMCSTNLWKHYLEALDFVTTARIFHLELDILTRDFNWCCLRPWKATP